jgi:hypothetical protein
MFAGIISGPTDEPAAMPHPPNIGDCEQVRLAGNAITPLTARDLISAVVEARCGPELPVIAGRAGRTPDRSRIPLPRIIIDHITASDPAPSCL